jgi:hypothetical protein
MYVGLCIFIYLYYSNFYIHFQEKYDVFISMSKMLRIMGHNQRAELLLYESLTLSIDPSEAHRQLSLLFIEKEDLERAKVHIKNCLFYRETDISLLTHLAVILICEGKIHEANFYVQRILTVLDGKVKKLAFLVQTSAQPESTENPFVPDTLPHDSFLAGIEVHLIFLFYLYTIYLC